MPPKSPHSTPRFQSRSSASNARSSFSLTPRNEATKLPPPREIMDGLVPDPIRIFDKPKPEVDRRIDKIEPKNLAYIGSYNWLNEKTPSIIVPGSPPEWQDRPLPYTVQPDQGVFFVDQNGHRFPDYVLLPLITAVDTKTSDDGSPPFDWSSVDFVTDRNNLRKLLRWVGGEKAEREFRIDMQLAGKKTILLNRWSDQTQEIMPGNTYGFNFEKASTVPASGCKSSTGHHRIINYDLGGLNMVVRFEVDACIPQVSKQRKSADIDDIVTTLSELSLPPTTTSESSASDKSAITVIKGGSQIPQSAIIEMTTRAEWRVESFDWTEQYPQLFLSQTPHHYLAAHKYGRFSEVYKRKLDSPELQAINRNMQPSIKKMKAVLDVIKSIVIEHGESGRLSLVYANRSMKLYQRKSQANFLPNATMKLFD